jgi:predicted N-acetyltransferase YhbS
VVERGWTATDLPWDGAGIAAVRTRLTRERPRRVWHVVAWKGDEPVGHATLNVTTGSLGVAGIYDMGVAVQARRRGIGSALTHAALALGRASGGECVTVTRRPRVSSSTGGWDSGRSASPRRGGGEDER